MRRRSAARLPPPDDSSERPLTPAGRREILASVPESDSSSIDALLARTAKSVRADPLCASQVAVARDGELIVFETFGHTHFSGDVQAARAASNLPWGVPSVP